MAQRIIVASGVEIRDTKQGVDLRALLNDRATKGKGEVWTFPPGPVAKARYEVALVFTMDEFKNALEEKDAWVVYSGHSRYGQGPAFGPARTPHCPTAASMPQNPWGVHFRMGWDATNTECMGDLLKHGVEPVEFDLLAARDDMFIPTTVKKAVREAKQAQQRIKRRKLTASERKHPCSIKRAWRSMDTCHADEVAKKSLRPSQPLKGRHYFHERQEKDDPPAQTTHPEYLTTVVAGHADLDQVDLKCSVLFMGSCSSKEHYLVPLVRHRRKKGVRCSFYLTTHINRASHARNFLDEVFDGTDPSSANGSAVMIKALNQYDEAGTVVVNRK